MDEGGSLVLIFSDGPRADDQGLAGGGPIVNAGKVSFPKLPRGRVSVLYKVSRC